MLRCGPADDPCKRLVKVKMGHRNELSVSTGPSDEAADPLDLIQDYKGLLITVLAGIQRLGVRG